MHSLKLAHTCLIEVSSDEDSSKLTCIQLAQFMLYKVPIQSKIEIFC